MSNIKRAVVYARYSSDNQREESIDAHIKAIKVYAEQKNMIFVGEYIDRAKSATTDNRPDFLKMIKDAIRIGGGILPYCWMITLGSSCSKDKKNKIIGATKTIKGHQVRIYETVRLWNI